MAILLLLPWASSSTPRQPCSTPQQKSCSIIVTQGWFHIAARFCLFLVCFSSLYCPPRAAQRLFPDAFSISCQFSMC